MDKQLLEQVEKALQAQQDTIERQKQMLDDKDRDIAELTNSLRKLAQTQSEQLQKLPSLFKNLESTINQHANTLDEWKEHRRKYAKSMKDLAIQSSTLANAVIRCVETMKDYQSTIVPADALKSDTERLEGKLSQLMNTQNEIDNSQKKITATQELIDQELKELDKLAKK